MGPSRSMKKAKIPPLSFRPERLEKSAFSRESQARSGEIPELRPLPCGCREFSRYTAVCMRASALAIATVVLGLVCIANADEPCRYMKSRSALSGYEVGGPYKIEHFQLTKGRIGLREFLWQHWHTHVNGIAEAKITTVDAGTVRALYVIQPDVKGRWGIDVELSRPVQRPHCSAFHADSLVRVQIRKPDEDYPSQTLGPYWPDGTVPKNVRMVDSEVKDAKHYTIILMANEKAIGNPI